MSSLFGGGGSKSQQPSAALGLDIQTAEYGKCLAVAFGKNKWAGTVIWYGQFRSIKHAQKPAGGKGGGSPKQISYTYTCSYMVAMCEGTATVSKCYDGASEKSLSGVGGIGFSGALGQAAWSNLAGNESLGYSGTSVIAFQNKDLGDNPSLPQLSFEMNGLNQLNPGGGVYDADPKDIATTVCTDTRVGVNFSRLGDLTQWSNYCRAAGLLFSPVYDTQQAASQVLTDLLKFSNAEGWYSEGVLKVKPRGDRAITGNGATFTPDLTPAADLGPNDLITNGPSPAVQIKRKSPADSMNVVRIEYKDRAQKYRTVPATATIDDDVVNTGVRAETSETVDMITIPTVGQLVANNMVARNFYVRNTYEFKVSWRYCYLEPMDIVRLTDADTGLNLTPVRILEISEDADGLLSVTAEEMPDGIGHADFLDPQSAAAVGVDPESNPGPITTPYFFRAPNALVSQGAPEVWVAVAGDNPLWAGCEVYISRDGSSYTYHSTYARESTYGVTTNALGVTTDPDTTSTVNVVLNGGEALLGCTPQECDDFVTLAMIDDEIISYQSATLAAGPSYNLGTRIRRGGYGSAITSHAAGAKFVRLDEDILRIRIDPSQVGSTIYVKFVSLNCFGRGGRTLADETAYTYVIGTRSDFPDVPAIPTNFIAAGVADGINLKWSNVNPAAVACTSIEFATSAAGPWTVLGQAGPTETFYHHAFNTGTVYYYRARARGHNVAGGWSAYTAVVNAQGYNATAADAAAQASADSAIAGLVGSGNLFGNTDFEVDSSGWGYEWNEAGFGAVTRDLAAPTYKPDNVHTIGITKAGATSTVQNAVVFRQEDVPVEAGKRYCVMGRVAAHRCNAGIAMKFVDGSGTTVLAEPTDVQAGYIGGTDLDNYRLSYIFMNAPAGAKRLRGGMWVQTIAGQSDPYAWLCRPLLSQVPAAQTNPPPYMPGAKGLATLAAAAQTSADTANAAIANITSDNVLSRVEKTAEVVRWNKVNDGLNDTRTKADTFAVSRVNFDTAFNALSSYLAGLSPGITDFTQDTTIVGSTYRTKWADYLLQETLLLNAIAAKAKQLADAAQGTANTALANAATAQTAANNAQADASNALVQLTDIASDGKLTADEKVQSKQRYNALTAEQSGIGVQATAYGTTAEKTNYDSAITALKIYLKDTVGVLDASYIWTGITGTTNITRSTWDTNWNTVYTYRQALLNAIAGRAKLIADTANTAINSRSGDNIIPNPSFELNSIGAPLNTGRVSGQSMADGWSMLDSTAGSGIIEDNYGIAARSGARKLTLAAAAGLSYGAGVSKDAIAYTADSFPVTAGDWYTIGGYLGIYADAAIPGGFTTRVAVLQIFENAAGGYVGENGFNVYNNVGANGLGGAAHRATAQVPANAVRCRFWFLLRVTNTNGSAASTPASGTICLPYIDDLSCVRVRDMDNDLRDGTTYGRTANTDLYEDAGIKRVGLNVKGSRKILGGARNSRASIVAGVTSVKSATALSATFAGAVTVNAHNLEINGETVSYNAVSNAITGLTQGTTYVIGTIDPYLDGGTRTYFAQTSVLSAQQYGEGAVFIGNVTIPTSGSTSGGGGGGGDPGNWCVDWDTVLPDGRLVRDLKLGDLVECIDTRTRERGFFPLLGIGQGYEECFRVWTENGRVIQSRSTAMDMRDGSVRQTVDLLGEEVFAFAPADFETVLELEPMGIRHVVKPDFGNRMFFAGEAAHTCIATHNIQYKP